MSTPVRLAVVIGAGRSGTSAITRALGALGYDLGNQLKPGGVRKNPKGFFEDEILLEITQTVHRLVGLHPTGRNVHLIPEAAWSNPALEPLQHRALQQLQGHLDRAGCFAFKAGGLLRVLPFWEQVLANLNIEVGFVMALRNPLNVAQSRARLDTLRGQQTKSDLEWLTGNLSYLPRLKERLLVAVDYDLMMSAPEGQCLRLAEALGHGAPDQAAIADYAGSFLTKDLYHHRADMDHLAQHAQVLPLARDTFLLLHQLAEDAKSGQDSGFWEALVPLHRELMRLGPLLDHVDQLEDRLRERHGGLGGLWATIRPRLLGQQVSSPTS
jgi:hypothetical protein